MNFKELFNKTNLISAHRGDRSQKPENTLSALASSVGRCDFIEIDVQLTKDLHPVIIHDDTLTRTSDVTNKKSFKERVPWKVSDFTLQELQSLDFGTWFNNTYEPILTLEKALFFVKEKQTFLNVEIKDLSNTFEDMLLVQIVIEKIRKTNTEHLILLSSFHHAYLPLCKEFSPNIPTAALQMYAHPNNLLDYLHILHVDAYHLEDNITDKKTVNKLKKDDFFLNVFTVNDPARQKELFSWGVNGVFTDFLDTRMED